MKRILSIFMVFVMVCLLSLAVFAEGESIIGNTYVFDDGSGNVMELAIVNETNCNMHCIFTDGTVGDMSGTYKLDGDIITVTAAGEEIGSLKIVGDTLVEINEDGAPYEETPVKYNVFESVWNFIITHRNTILEIVILIFLMWLRRKTNKVGVNVEANTLGNASVIDSQGGVVGVVNTMIDGYNAFKTDFAKVKQSDAERDKQLAAVMVTNTAILEILTRVYPNSKNLPQGVKDVVNMTYANAMKAINDDEQLSALVTASKGLLAAGTEKAASDEEAV